VTISNCLDVHNNFLKLNEVFLHQIYVIHDIQFGFVKTHVHLLSFLGLDDFEFDFETMFEEYLKYLYILYMSRYLKNTNLCAGSKNFCFVLFCFFFWDKILPIIEGKRRRTTISTKDFIGKKSQI